MPVVNKTYLLTIVLVVAVGCFLVLYAIPGVFVLALVLDGITGRVVDGTTVYAARDEGSLQVLERSMGKNLADQSRVFRETDGGVVTLTAGTVVYTLSKRKSSDFPATKIFVKDGKYRWSILFVPDKYMSSIKFPGVTGYP